VAISFWYYGHCKTGDLDRLTGQFFHVPAIFHTLPEKLACNFSPQFALQPNSNFIEVQKMHEALEHGCPISLLVAEHSRMGCNLMETALRRCRHITVTASVVESSEFSDAFKLTNPDVCIVSSSLKDGPTAGFRVTREHREIDRRVCIVMLLEASERALVVEAFRSGARGVLSRDDPFDMLPKCIQKVHEGQVWANSQQLSFLLESVAENAPPAITDARGATLLTSRELGLVQLVAEGRTNRDISRELRLSEHTVRNYLFRIFNKLGVSTRLELALYAINQRGSSTETYRAES
jgi:DNA-binding NarL/FixJ family response regulator